jgi:glycosyltransferase involved in cell wall biosynthesis
VSGPQVTMIEFGGRGGVADYTQALVGALAAAGRPVELLTARDHLYRPAPGVTVRGVVPWIRGTSAPARLARRLRLGPAVNALRFLLVLPRIVAASRRTGVAHVQGEFFPPLTALLAVVLRGAGVTVVRTAHGTFDRGQSHGWAHRVLTAASDATIVHTTGDLERLGPAGAGRATVIPHGEYGGLARTGGPVERPEARAELGLGEDTVAVILFGQLRADKGIGDLLAAAKPVPGLHVIVAGEDIGGLSAAALELADPGLAGRVTVREGFLEMTAVAQLFAAADAAVLPYTVASQSGVLLLAYGFERPVVAYPVGGLAEAVVDGETGWLCARPDPEALTATLREVVGAGRAECARRGMAGGRLSRERYSWDAIARATAAVYDAANSERTAAE